MLSTLSAIITPIVNKRKRSVAAHYDKIQKPRVDRRTALLDLSPICFACIIQGSMLDCQGKVCPDF